MLRPEAECPHNREPETCRAANDASKAYECSSSRPPHDVRRGEITHWLANDVPVKAVSARCDTAPCTPDRHYDKRSSRQQQRRKYLDRVE